MENQKCDEKVTFANRKHEKTTPNAGFVSFVGANCFFQNPFKELVTASPPTESPPPPYPSPANIIRGADVVNASAGGGGGT